MNIQQFQYILAVAENRHFELAAEKCFVTQSTLSTMISRFEEEVGIRVFDRKRKPVALTQEGLIIVEHLKRIVNDLEQLKEISREMKGEIKGNLSISVIPTVAPYLLPLFLQSFADKFPDLHIRVNEQSTDEIIRQLKARELDIGILSIPLKEKDILEVHLYDEPFVFFDAGKTGTGAVSLQNINSRKLCLMEEGHCMRTQIMNLCELNKKLVHNQLNFEFQAGSIDSLLRFVRANRGTTLLPHLSTLDLTEKEKKHTRKFSSPVPYRSLGLAVHRHFVKKKILKLLHQHIQEKTARVLPQKKISGDRLAPV